MFAVEKRHPLAATSLHAQDARQSLAVNRDRDEIVAGRDLVRRAAASPAPTATEAEPLRDALNVPGEQQLPDWLELIGVAARLRHRVEHDIDARNEPRAVAFLRRRKRDGRRCLALEIPYYAMQPRTR